MSKFSKIVGDKLGGVWLKVMPLPKHKLTEERCAVAHMENGHLLPSCKKCSRCGGWIRYPYNTRCAGREK